MSIYSYGMRFDDDSNAITVIDEENQTAATTGYINGEPVEFSGGGGGGSSDFSTAEVTVVANGSGHNLAIPHIVETPSGALVGTVGAMGEGSIDVVTVLMYKGQCVISGLGGDVETSGNIQDVGGGFYLITGDCTITIS